MSAVPFLSPVVVRRRGSWRRRVSYLFVSALALQSQGFLLNKISTRCRYVLIEQRAREKRVFFNLRSATSLTSQPARLGWEARIQQLRDFKQVHGHTHVRRNTVDPPGLANWVNKQRQMYVRYQNGTRPCSLNKQRIAALEELGFCWDGRRAVEERFNSVQERTWSDSLNEFQTVRLTNTTEIPAHSKLGQWLRQQRLALARGHLTQEQQNALRKIDPEWWMNRQQRAWEQHFRALQAYAEETGDCCVPISHSNRQLANFVANQRKQYNLRQKERPSTITEERIKRLESIGFAWNRWEYEFAKNRDLLH